VSCADCHNSHSPDSKSWSLTSFSDTNQVCYKCHAEQRGPFVFEHEAMREGCTICHMVHGSVNDKLLIARDSNVCLQCHFQTQTDPNRFLIGDFNHDSRLPRGTCFSGECHTAIHGSNFDDHLRY
jgi:DmsE family decaheme c-type cytochrome